MGFRALAVALALGLALAACSPTAAVESQSSAAPLTAVATVFPLAWIAAEIGPAAKITQLGGRGIDPHDLELTPSEHALVGAADLAFD
ncbi:MAG TPA: zinc ABC transporter substrate-binding protein, partial [Egibacteraceae bacterium]|nr:zinc ABC transporter substrate-binding protein [Egibacteraceae bacterium]